MQPPLPSTFRPAIFGRFALICLAVLVALSWLYTYTTLRIARSQGLYATSEEGMLDMVARNFVQPEKVQIVYAGTNSSEANQPYVHYAVACVWGGTRLDGSPVGSEQHVYSQPGHFFLDTRQGWVFIPEGAFPEVLGFFMKLYGMAGPGSSQPFHDFDDLPKPDCEF
jgi:hypothetical protein